MLSTLCCAAALCAASDEVPVLARELQLAVRVTPTSFVALNPTDQPEVVVLFDRASGRNAKLIVPAHGAVDAGFPAATLRGLELAIVARSAGGPVVCGTWSVEALRDRTRDFVWFDAEQGHAHAWSRTPNGFELLDEQANAAGFGPHLMCSPPPPAPLPHVPVITPNDGSKGDLPPRLRRDPLPPV